GPAPVVCVAPRAATPSGPLRRDSSGVSPRTARRCSSPPRPPTPPASSTEAPDRSRISPLSRALARTTCPPPPPPADTPREQHGGARPQPDLAPVACAREHDLSAAAAFGQSARVEHGAVVPDPVAGRDARGAPPHG